MTLQEDPSYALNVRVSPVHLLKPSPSMVLGGGAFGRSLDDGGGALMTGLETL